MKYKPLFFFVEGADDIRFVEKVFCPVLSTQFYPIIPIPCSEKTAKQIMQEVYGAQQACQKHEGEYFYLLDKDDRPCITRTKEWLAEKRQVTNVESGRILVVVKKIEGWYLAGEEALVKLKLRETHEIDKPQFEYFAQSLGWKDVRDYKISLLQSYDIVSARARNSSLDYCLAKMGI